MTVAVAGRKPLGQGEDMWKRRSGTEAGQTLQVDDPLVILVEPTG